MVVLKNTGCVILSLLVIITFRLSRLLVGITVNCGAYEIQVLSF